MSYPQYKGRSLDVQDGAALSFWQKLDFQKTTEVPHGEDLGFVILQNGAIEVM